MPETINKLTRAEQSRINVAKSLGPITPEGKAKSSRNSLKHGFAAIVNVVLRIEDKAPIPTSTSSKPGNASPVKPKN